jgi:hypothetical protein
MAAIPGDIDTDHQPPMTLPLCHFVVGIGFLFVGSVLGVGSALGVVPGFGGLAHVHLLLAGWVCVTIMGAMTQFVPVWSGVPLHSRRLASVQLPLLGAGLVGFVAALLTGSMAWLAPFGSLMLAGFWTFVYNVGRTLAAVDDYDVTERHFLLALGFFVLLTTLGVALAVDFAWPVLAPLGIARSNAVAAHATLAVFGAVLTTVYGALYQLGTMFTQTELHGVDEYLRGVEEAAHPVGVVLLAGGRFAGSAPVARVGGALVVAAALAFGVVLARKLVEMRVDWTPMHTRYAVAVPWLLGWALLAAPAWLRAPLAPAHRFGAAGTGHLLALGAVGFVVFGTLYHIVPFIVWVHRYSDRLGFEDVPMVDDLYDDGLAAADATCLLAGAVALVASAWVESSTALRLVGGGLVTVGVVAFGANMLSVIRSHSPHTVGRIVVGSLDPRRGSTPAAESGSEDVSGRE